MLIIIRGAGDIASGIALRLHRSGFPVIMTDLERPTAIRRTVCFSEALHFGSIQVEDVEAMKAEGSEEARILAMSGKIAVLADPEGSCIKLLKPDAVVDAILAKRNLGTTILDAPVVVGVGPGFTAGLDCHAAVETKRGHYLGRVIYEGSTAPDTGIPGNIGGYTRERVLRAPKSGIFHPLLHIGDEVEKGDIAGMVGETPMLCTIHGILRGILPEGTPVHEGMKSGDIDPRCEKAHCFLASDKALSVGGGVLEAILHFCAFKCFGL